MHPIRGRWKLSFDRKVRSYERSAEIVETDTKGIATANLPASAISFAHDNGKTFLHRLSFDECESVERILMVSTVLLACTTDELLAN